MATKGDQVLSSREVPAPHDRLIVTRETVSRAITACLFALDICEDYDVPLKKGQGTGDFLIALTGLRKALGLPADDIEEAEERREGVVFLGHGYVEDPQPMPNGSEHGQVIEW